MTRAEIIADHPIDDFVRSCGHNLKRAGENFVTSGCPKTRHKSGHRPVTLDTRKQLWHCNDRGIGGTVIDWEKIERGCTAGEAMRILGGGRNGERPRLKQIRGLRNESYPAQARPLKVYDYTDEKDELLFQVLRYPPKRR